MKVKTESDLLKIEIRKKIIEEIEGRENVARKYEAFKRYQCYKDKTSAYVVDLLLRQFDVETVEEMRYALSNVSIVKKVIDKLARVYSNGVERTISGDDAATEKLKTLEKVLDINTAMKKVNRFLKLEKNVDLFIKPCPVYGKDESELEWTIKLEALLPFLYDVIEDCYDRTRSIAVVMSDYQPLSTSLADMDGKRSPIPFSAAPSIKPDGVDQVIADSPQDSHVSIENKKTYIFWSKNFHFTCDANGEFVVDQNNLDNENPLKVFNHINFAIDQDGAFWAEGGNDLIDGAILINALVSHTVHVGTIQGYGQFYMTGENLPRAIKVGPTKAIIAEYKKDEQAEPKMGFLNANPQLDSLRGLIEMYIALYLTTNNLSTSGVATQLSGGQSLPSGIALILDKAESMEDIQDQRQIFIDREPDAWKAINQALTEYGDALLVEDLKGLQLPEGFEENFNIKFHDPTAIMSETEKLTNMKARQDLGIDTTISLMMKDDPTLTEDQAEEKLMKMIEQRIEEKMIEQETKTRLGYEDEGGDLYGKDSEDSAESESESESEGTKKNGQKEIVQKKPSPGNNTKFQGGKTSPGNGLKK